MGGILGAILRFLIKNIHMYKGIFPFNTLIINIIGSFILALILTLAFEVMDFDSDIRIGIATGFLGAFTTFSTMIKETVVLINSGYYYSAILNLTVSTLLGLVVAYLGIVIAREVISKMVSRQNIKEGVE